jgi:serine/threonine-protein kinase HipA
MSISGIQDNISLKLVRGKLFPTEKDGEYILTPAYDLIGTSLHFPEEGRTAINLFATFETESFRRNAFYKRPDFLKLAEFYGMNMARAGRCSNQFADNKDRVLDLIGRSFLSDPAKADIRNRFDDRLKAIAD